MRALQFDRESHTLSFLSELLDPVVLNPYDVIVEVWAAGVCGTDLHILEGGLDPILPAEVVLGHEVVGVVRETGSEVRDLQIGQLVALQPMGRCLMCRACQLGTPNLCDEAVTGHLGYGFNGGWAELCRISADHVLPVSQALESSPELAVLIEPMGGVLNGYSKVEPYLRGSSSILILGGGLIGSLWASVLSFRGFRNILVVEPSETRRRNISVIRGVTAVAPTDLPLHKDAIDVIIECCGVAKAVEAAMETLRDGGTMLLFGIFSKGSFARLSLNDVMFREITILSALGNCHTFAEAAALVAAMSAEGALTVEGLGLKIFVLEAYERALAELAAKSITKAILKPSERAAVTERISA